MVLLIVDKRYLRKKIRYINNLKQKFAKWERLGFESIAKPVEYHVWEQQRGKELRVVLGHFGCLFKTHCIW